MLLYLRLIIIIILALIALQDMKSRCVHWLLFPVLAGGFVWLRLAEGQIFYNLAKSTFGNVVFFSSQLIVITAYFSIRNRGLVNITSELLGWGDVLFLLAVAVSFPLSLYVIFYVGSLIVTLITWVIVRPFMKNKQQIPLAGIQAVLLIVFLLLLWKFGSPEVFSDFWALH